MIVYSNIGQYLESQTSLLAKITALDTVIMNMITAAATAATTGQFEEYKFDDGQSKIETVYRDVNALTKSIASLQLLRDTLEATLNNNRGGRVKRLLDSKNLRTGYYGTY